MTPQEVAELSRLLDEALALELAERESWLGELERSRPDTARHLRSMLAHTKASDTTLLPKLPPMDDDAIAQAGERVGPYVLAREIGRGGMGSVWLADRADGTFKRRVALKLPRLTWAAGLSKRMVREREIGALLEHPNIARLYDAGVDEHGRPYIAMEYIEGRPIDAYCREHVLDIRTRLKLFLQVVQAVAYAHGRLVLHRDLKPGNVLVDASGQAHLLDFGIAKLLDEAARAGTQLTREQGRMLTLNYAAPEQILGRPLGVTADVYALGVMLFELLTATLPYRVKRETAGALEDAILAGDAPLASSRLEEQRTAKALRGDLDAILAKAIKREASERYPTAEGLAADIQRYLDGHAILARPDSTWYRLRKWVTRHRVPVAALGAVMSVAIIGGAATWLQGQRAIQEADRTRLTTAFVAELFQIGAAGANTGAPTQTVPAAFVDRGAQLIQTRFHGQPEIQAELYGAIGRAYLTLGANALAAEYAARQLRSLRDQRANADQLARALMLLSEASWKADRDADAERYAREAVEVLSASDSALPDALTLLARAQLRNRDDRQASDSVAEASRVLRLRGTTKSSAGAWLKFVEGTLLRRANKFDEAEPVLDAATAEALEVEGPASPTAAEIRIARAKSLTAMRRYDEARAHFAAASAALAEAGDLGRIRLAKERALFQALLFDTGVGSYAEAVQALEDASTHLRTKGAVVPREMVAELESLWAYVYQNRGEFTLAKPLLDSSAAVLLGSTQSLFWQMRLSFLQGYTAMYLGDHDAADRLLRKYLDLQLASKEANHPMASYSWTSVAMNINMQGRHSEVEAFLRGAPTLEQVRGAPLTNYERAIPEMVARARLDAGDVKGAKQSLPTDEPPEEDIWDLNSYYQLRGEIRCASGEHKAGLADLMRSLRSQSRIGGPNHPWLARLRAVAGLCALEQGNRKQAEELAHDARRAFVAQPNVSSYFKEPLRRLDKQLGVKAI